MVISLAGSEPQQGDSGEPGQDARQGPKQTRSTVLFLQVIQFICDRHVINRPSINGAVFQMALSLFN